MQERRFLPVEQADTPEVVRAETTEVNLHVLRVVNLDPVDEHTSVLASQTPDIDGLEAPDSAVVAHLHAGEPPHGLGDVGGGLKLLTGDPLRHDDAPVG